MKDLAYYIDCFQHLRRGVTKFGPAPHKLILLLAVLDEVELGRMTHNRFEISDQLIEKFLQLWQNYVSTEHSATFALPFFHLHNDGFWQLHAHSHKADWLKQQPSISALGPLRDAVQYAQIDSELFQLFIEATAREVLRQTLLHELSKTGYGPIRKQCPFCNIRSTRGIIAENELALAFHDAFPVSDGHTLVIPKRHIADFFMLEKEEISLIHDLSLECRGILQKEFHPNGFNVGVNVGTAAGQTIFHCHVHLIPRYNNDVLNPRGGVRGVIPSKQSY
ncbi:MAG: HIT domain-containing protein [Victivallaceae bacterium]